MTRSEAIPAFSKGFIITITFMAMVVLGGTVWLQGTRKKASLYNQPFEHYNSIILNETEETFEITDPEFYSGSAVSFSRISYSATFTDQYRAIWELKERENSETIYLELIRNGNSESAIYGLMGLKLINSSHLDDIGNSLQAKSEMLTYGRGGCLLMSEPAGNVVKMLMAAELENPEAKHRPTPQEIN